MKIIIDGEPVEFYHEDQNIVDITARENIPLPAPCYQAGRTKGCCQVCLVEIDKERKYACVTRPADGMKIVIDRADLNEIRRRKISEYEEIPALAVSACGCSCSCSTSNCC